MSAVEAAGRRLLHTADRRVARIRLAPLVVTAAAVGWAVVCAVKAVGQYDRFGAARFDLGNMTQTVWNTAHGHILEETLGDGTQASRLASHVDPILMLFAPAAWLFPVPQLLVVGQAVALAAGAYPVYRLAVRHLSSEAAGTLLALAYLAYPWIAWQTLNDFHPVSLAIPLLLFAAWWLDTDRLLPFAVATGLALLTGELIGLGLLGLAAWHWGSRRRRRASIVIVLSGVAWTGIALRVIVPAFAPSGQNAFYDRYSSVGGSPLGILRTTATDPTRVLGAMTNGDDIFYVLLLCLPLLLFFLWAPLALLGAVPQLGLNLLADWSATTSPIAQYVSGIVPYLFLATVVGIARFFPTRKRRIAGSAFVFAACLVAGVLLGPWFGVALHREHRPKARYFTETHENALRAAVALIPDGAPVSVTNQVGSQLSERRFLYSVPVVGRATWIVVDALDTWVPQSPGHVEGRDASRMRRFRQSVGADPHWRLRLARDDVFVYQRVL
jgi:uncharacterized membrane protein